MCSSDLAARRTSRFDAALPTIEQALDSCPVRVTLGYVEEGVIMGRASVVNRNTWQARAWVLALMGALVACEPLADGQDFSRQDVLVFRRSQLVPAPAQGATPQLKVVAWNIKYGAGRIPFWFDCWGDRVQMSKAEVDANMAAIYQLINEVKPDILVTEEIEINSKRSAYVDMVRGILEHTDLNYAAYYETWDSRYIASEGVGRMNLGNAIFSRYPITRAERIRQQDRTDQDEIGRAHV